MMKILDNLPVQSYDDFQANTKQNNNHLLIDQNIFSLMGQLEV